MIIKSIIECQKRYDKSETKLFGSRFDPDFSLHDQYKLNVYDLLPLVVVNDDEQLHAEEET